MSTKLNVTVSLISTAGFIILNMYLAKQGLFNPNGPEFYWTAIVSALLIYFPAMLLLPRLITKQHKITASILEKQVSLSSEEETAVLEEGASHVKGIEAVGGKLFLTADQLIFKSHKFDIQNHTEAFLLDKIYDVRIMKNRFLTFEYEGKLQKFAVINKEQWVYALSKPVH